MAANFWASTHNSNWLQKAALLLQEESAMRLKDRELFSVDELVRIRVGFAQFISTLAKKSNLRQRVVATACVYFKRFYLRNAYRDHDPRLIAPAALYLAAKTEEHTVQAKAVISQVNAMYKADHSYPYGVRDLYEYEFRIIAELDFDLLVFHPYRPLTQLCSEIDGMKECLQTAWAILNDSYRTDVCLVYPPYIVAIACLFMAASVLDKYPEQWIQRINVSARDLISVVRTISDLYAPASVQQTGPRFIEKIHRKLQDHFSNKKKIVANDGSRVQLPVSEGSKAAVSRTVEPTETNYETRVNDVSRRLSIVSRPPNSPKKNSKS
uniref:Cyclin-like domain-containing protein n=2 Tax=Compsopogon caeruleus TaxID=31354 RepID=A0A7S1XES2_9RHOD|mmetsp:Transcript_18162/g.37827  ORF Transcript_18162/g.37827 Transcript_18162/m.37827 type:complete len:324 (+) Transcript_18162:57-1028(+)